MSLFHPWQLHFFRLPMYRCSLVVWSFPGLSTCSFSLLLAEAQGSVSLLLSVHTWFCKWFSFSFLTSVHSKCKINKSVPFFKYKSSASHGYNLLFWKVSAALLTFCDHPPAGKSHKIVRFYQLPFCNNYQRFYSIIG